MIRLGFICFFAIIIASCREKRLDNFDWDSFEGDRLVLKLLMGAHRNADVNVRKTLSPLANLNEVDSTTQISIFIEEASGTVELLQKTGPYTYVGTDNLRFEPGKSYRIRASYNNSNVESSFVKIPNQISIIHDYSVYEPDSNKIQVGFQFQDIADEENYYIIQGEFKQNGKWFKHNIIASSFSAPCSEALQGADAPLLLTDLCFQGQQQNLTYWFPTRIVDSYINANPIYTYNDSARIILLHLNIDYYQYIRTLSSQYVANTDPFSNPPSVYSNIIGGYGIVAGFAADTLTFDVW